MNVIFKHLFLCMTIAWMTLTPVMAQSWPTKPVRLLVPFPPGGVTDALARIVSTKLGVALGQSVVVENRPGAATIIATREAVQAAPDGYTLLLGVTQLAINPALQNDLPYNALKHLEPIVQLGDVTGFVAVHHSHPAKTFNAFTHMGTAAPINVAIPGVASVYHIALELLNQKAGTKLVSIGYKGSGESIRDVIGGHVPVTVDGVVSLAPHIKSGSLRGLAVLARNRSSDFPDIPTTAELGMPDVVISAFIGLMAPSGTPKAVIDRVNKEVNAILKQPDTVAQARNLGLELVGGSVGDFKVTIEKATKTYADVIKSAGIKLEKN